MKTRLFVLLVSVLCLPMAWGQTTAPSSKKTARPAAPAPVSEEPASAEALVIAQLVHVGQMPCELGATVQLKKDPAAPGYFNVNGKGFRYRMKAVNTTTGAIRLEDAKAGAVWLQLANKSMLMDQKNGRRVADECAHPDQLAFAQEMIKNPPPSLIDTTGMGR